MEGKPIAEHETLGLQLYSMEVSSADKYESAFKEAVKSGSAGLAVTQQTLAMSNQKQIVNLAAKHSSCRRSTRGENLSSAAA